MTDQSRVELVKFFDTENGQIVEIPKSELAAGAVQVQFEGMEDLVWVIAGELKQSEVRHPPFSGQRREYVEFICSSFMEHRQMSYEDWEIGFRRDSDPDSEIALWVHTANIYHQYTEDEHDKNRR